MAVLWGVGSNLPQSDPTPFLCPPLEPCWHVTCYFLKVVHRQESEETISASEASDDNYDVPEERPSIARTKQNARETRSQAAERRAESSPTLRNLRGQRNIRNRSSEGKPSRDQMEDGSNTRLHEVDNPVAADQSNLSTAGADEARIIVVDTIKPQGQSCVLRGVVGSRDHSYTQVSPMDPRGPALCSTSEVYTAGIISGM